ncbi:hypothetical protein B0T18DRAFT_488348 [Schizothecium vesticola]|uniref:Uncharacterized protein n=1 Tax=Schizothecium vesticola TaxID=314040 RepID=A0AA40EU56_9PEZI|nr:hypothetical protein B0T18DRAFT_488348 [Schizothecium vesticola]
MSDALASSRSSFRKSFISEWPLTTVYTPAGECTSVFDIYGVANAQITAEITLSYHYFPAWTTACWVYPSKAVINLFSPGLVCPDGYTSALTKLNSKVYLSSGWTQFTPTGASEAQFSKWGYDYLLPDETMVLCCPSQYKVNLADGQGYYCTRALLTGIITGYPCYADDFQWASYGGGGADAVSDFVAEEG